MPKNIFSLEGKTALVTGASRGIGLAIGKALVDAGADILALSRSGQLDELQLYCEKQGRKFKGYACDLSDRQAVSAFTSMITAINKPIDILINNAGTILRKAAD